MKKTNKPMNVCVSIKLTVAMKERLDEIARKSLIPCSTIMRIFIEKALDKIEDTNKFTVDL